MASHYLLYRYKKDIESILSAIENSDLPADFSIRFLFLISDSDIFNIVKSRTPSNFIIKITEDSESILTINLAHPNLRGMSYENLKNELQSGDYQLIHYRCHKLASKGRTPKEIKQIVNKTGKRHKEQYEQGKTPWTRKNRLRKWTIYAHGSRKCALCGGHIKFDGWHFRKIDGIPAEKNWSIMKEDELRVALNSKVWKLLHSSPCS